MKNDEHYAITDLPDDLREIEERWDKATPKSQEFAPSWCVDLAYQVWNSHSVVDVAKALHTAYKRGLFEAAEVAERIRERLRQRGHGGDPNAYVRGDGAQEAVDELRRKAEEGA